MPEEPVGEGVLVSPVCMVCGMEFGLTRIPRACGTCRLLACPACTLRDGKTGIQSCSLCNNPFHRLPEPVLMMVLALLGPLELLDIECCCMLFHSPRYMLRTGGLAGQQVSLVERCAREHWGYNKIEAKKG